MRLRKQVAVLLVVFVVACASSPQRVTFDAIGVASIAVDTSMRIYADRVVAGQLGKGPVVPQATQEKVKADYATYISIMKDAQLAVDAWYALAPAGQQPPPVLFPAAKVGAALTLAGSIEAEVK